MPSLGGLPGWLIRAREIQQDRQSGARHAFHLPGTILKSDPSLRWP